MSTSEERLVARVRALLSDWDRDMSIARVRAPADSVIERRVEALRAAVREYDEAEGPLYRRQLMTGDWNTPGPSASTPSITCPRCGRTSYHPKDIEHRYCGACHVFWGDER